MVSYSLLFMAFVAMTTTAKALTRYTIKGGRTSAAELKTDAKYVIYNTAENSHFFLKASAAGYDKDIINNPSGQTSLSLTTTDDSYIWQLETGDTDGTYKIKSIGAGQYSAGGTNLNAIGVDYAIADYMSCQNKGNGVSYIIDGQTVAHSAITSEHKLCYVIPSGDALTGLTYWNGNNSGLAIGKGHAYAFYEVQEEVLPSQTVTYKVVYNGNILTTVTVEQEIGSAASVPESLQAAYTTYSYDVQTIEQGTTEVIATPTFNTPFTISENFENATWYCLRGKSNVAHHYIYSNGDDIVWSTAIAGSGDAYRWAFLGNPITGITLINKAAGENKSLSNTDPCTLASSDNPMAWTLKAQTNTSYQANAGEKGFGLFDNNRNNYANAQSATLKYWGAFDEGSTFWVEEESETYEYIISQLESIETNLGENMGEYSYGAEYKGKTAAEIKGDAKNFDLAVAMYNSVTLNAPQAGVFLRISGKFGKNLAAGISTTGPYNYNTAEDATTIFYYDGTHLQNFSTGLYVGMTNGNSATENWGWPAAVAEASSITLGAGSTSGTFTLYIGKGDSYAYLRVNSDENCVRRGALNGDGSDWTLTEISKLPVEIGESGWATFAAPVATVVPEGVTAYTATAEGLNLTLTAIEAGSIIPANTGVLLSGSNGSHDFEVTTGGSVSDNVFTGTTEATTVDANSTFVLANNNDELGFYLLKSTEMPAFKAYIAKSAVPQATESSVFRIVLGDDDITAITDATVAGAEGTATYYDLQGRRVAAPEKGQLYIVNGKKVLY